MTCRHRRSYPPAVMRTAFGETKAVQKSKRIEKLGGTSKLPVWQPRFIALVLGLIQGFGIGAGRNAAAAEAITNAVSVQQDIAYKSGTLSEYEQQRCKLDLYLPEGRAGFPILVWFHGGALQTGTKDDEFNMRIARRLAEEGLGVALANYRLTPNAKYPSYVEDAAAAFAWVHAHIAERGGDSSRVFVGGHSAGAYLALMIGLDTRYLRQCGLETTAIAGVIPVSGQTMTHYTIREERGLPKERIFADEAAPIHYARRDAPPMLVLYADNDMPARAEENHYLAGALKAAGNSSVVERMIEGRDHGSIAGSIPKPGDPTAAAMLAFVDAASVKPAQDLAARFGVNLSGAEFGGGKIPGVLGRDYTYPATNELEYLVSRGRKLIRLPFLWERMQGELNAPLDGDELGRVRRFLAEAGRRGMSVILDPHSYGRYHFAGEKEGQIIGSGRVPAAAFADFWFRLASACKGQTGLCAYGLMNEPHDMGDAERWPQAAQAAVSAIRRADPRTLIIVPGDGWSSARGWQAGPNRDLDKKVRDPENHLMFEAHCYFDRDGSGRYAKSYEAEGGSPDVGINYVKPFVEWCRMQKVRGFVGEYGVPDSDARWLVTMDRFVTYLRDNNISATYWSAGPWWGKYPLSIEPEGLGKGAPGTAAIDRPQMMVLRRF